MTEGDIRQFSEAWAGAWDHYGRNQTSAGIKLAFRALKDLQIETVLAALAAHINEQPKEPPTAGAIRQRIQGDPDARAHLAWVKFRKAMRQIGPYPSIAFDDPILHAVIRDLGGWVACSDWKTDDLPFRERDFHRAYRVHVQREGFTFPAYLIGANEAQNAAAGFDKFIEPPVLFGDPAAAERVMRDGQHEQLAHRPDKRVAQLALDIRQRRPRPPMEQLRGALTTTTGGSEE